jgi:hypothetical protein
MAANKRNGGDRVAPSNSAAFLAGRDLAAQMIRTGHNADVPDGQATIEARYRDGAQDNFALRYLQALLERPELADGFAAVLSDYLSAGGCVDPEVYERLSIGEMLGAKADAPLQDFISAVLATAGTSSSD